MDITSLRKLAKSIATEVEPSLTQQDVSIAVVTNSSERCFKIANVLRESGVQTSINTYLTSKLNKTLRGRARILVVFDYDVDVGDEYNLMFMRSLASTGFKFPNLALFVVVDENLSELQPHEQRVVEEKRVLDENIAKLNAFVRLENPKFMALSDDAQSLMERQCVLMEELSLLLGQRIALFTKEHHEEN